MSKVSIEALARVASALGDDSSNRVVLEEELEAGMTVADLLDKLAARYPRFSETVLDPQTGRVAGHMTVILNERLLEIAGEQSTPLKAGDIIRFVPMFEGG